MIDKKQWTQRQGEMLRYLFEEEKMSKWSKIAQRMAEEFKFPTRNGKQCRELQLLQGCRYQTHIRPSFQHQEWTEQEQQKMYDLHNEIGNKWAKIAENMPGRSDNCVKNRIYSKIRKAIRQLNKTINSKQYRQNFKQIRQTVLYKIIQATDQKFKKNPNHKIASISNGTSTNIIEIKNSLLFFSKSDDEQLKNEDIGKGREIILLIQEFCQLYKRKPKKQRRGHAQVQNLLKVQEKMKEKLEIFSSSVEGWKQEKKNVNVCPPILQMPTIQRKAKCFVEQEEDNDDDSLCEIEDQDSIHMCQEQPIKKQVPKFSGQNTNKQKLELKHKSSFKLRKNCDQFSQQQKQSLHSLYDSCQGVEMTLKHMGVLQDAGCNGPSANIFRQLMNDSYNFEKNQQFSEKKQHFNLGASIENNINNLRFSITIKQSGELYEDNLFKSNNLGS